MLRTAVFFELRRCSDVEIFAVPYRDRCPREAVRLPDGAIVEAPNPDERCDVPDGLRECLGVGPAGGPATRHHEVLGLVRGFASFAGVYLLPSGEVAAVYGAHVMAID